MPSIVNTISAWIKASLRSAIWQYRRASWQSRTFPDFIIIGAQKSGTTSLYNYLAQHPQLVPSYRKEVHFFDGGLDPKVDHFERGPAWYRAHFPLIRNLPAKNKTFEASPLYIFNPLAPGRIFNLIPEVKLIALLRNPTERAISHYFHERRKHRESLPILDALQAEENRLAPIRRAKDYKNAIFINCSYKSRGVYKDQIENYLNYFSRSQMLIINSEQFFSEPERILKRVFEFVGVYAEFTVEDLQPRNVASNRSTVAPDVYEYLNSYFRPHNQALSELLGETYGW